MASKPAIERPIVLSNQSVGVLMRRFDEYRIGEILALEGVFTVRDIDRDFGDTEAVIGLLQRVNAIEVVGETNDTGPNSNKHFVNEYRWHPEVKQWIRQQKADRDELPCGCRAHVKHSQDGEFTCKYCDDDPVFDQADVKEVVF